MAIVGRYEDKDNVFNPRKTIKLLGGKFVMKGLKIKLENLKYDDGKRYNYFISFHSDAVSDVDAFHVDECSVSNLCKIFVRQENSAYAMKQVRIVNTDVEIDRTVTENTMQILYLTSCQCLNRIEEITFNNNIVFHRFPESGTVATTCRVVDVEAMDDAIARYSEVTVWNASISFCNNTMYNVPTPHSFVKFYKVASLKMTRNICSVDPTFDSFSGYMCWLYTAHQDSQINVSDNIYYGLITKNWNVVNSSSAWKPSPNNLTREPEDPLQTIDFDTCTFTPKAQYAAYGAKR